MDKIMHGVGEQKAGVAPLPTTSMDLPQIALPLFANHRLMQVKERTRGARLSGLSGMPAAAQLAGLLGVPARLEHGRQSQMLQAPNVSLETCVRMIWCII